MEREVMFYHCNVLGLTLDGRTGVRIQLTSHPRMSDNLLILGRPQFRL